MKKAIYTFVCAVILPLALTGCEGALTPSSHPPSASPSLSPFPTLSSTPTQTTPAPFREESPDELEQVLAPTATPTPSLFPSTFPDLVPPPGGWIAFRTPEGHLVLISSDASRFIPLTEQGKVTFAWSPDGHWLAFTVNLGNSRGSQLALVSIERSRLIPIPLTEQGKVTYLAWSPDGRWLAFTINLGDYRGGQLALFSLENSRLIPLTRPGEVDPGSLTWSQNSRSLAYFYYTEPEKEIGQAPARSPMALRVFDLSTHQVVTLTTYSNAMPGEFPSLCRQAFPFPFLAVEVGGCSLDSSLQIWDTQAGKMVVELGSGSHWSGSHCKHLWLPEGQGMVFPKVELEKEGIKQEGVQEDILYPSSVSFWKVGDEAPVIVLEGVKKRSYFPVRWLPDGRLEVGVTHWEKEEYEGPAQPEHVTYRFFYVSEEGELREAGGSDLPWWAAGGFQERLAAARLPQSTSPAISRLSGCEVGPDEETVIFTWRWVVDEESKSAIYLWQGEGEPVRLSMGEYPRWQPKAPIFSPTPSLP